MNEDEIRNLIAAAQEAAIATKSDRAKIAPSDYVFPDWKKCPITSQGQATSAAKLIAKVKKPDGSALSDGEISAAKSRAKRIMKRKGFTLPKAWMAKSESFVMSSQMRLDAIQAALDEEKDPDMDGDDDSSYDSYDHPIARHDYPKDDTSGTVVFQMGWDGDWFKRDYTIDANGEATLGDGCTQVSPQLSFASITDADEKTESMASQALASLDNRDTSVPFDKAYLQKAVDHHETAIHLATKASTEAKDDRVKALAKKIVKEQTPHLNEVKAMHGVIVTGTSNPAGSGSEAKTESVHVVAALFHEVLESSTITADDNGGFTVGGTAIMPGLNRSGNRVYPKETLAAAVPLFVGKKMYVDHPSAFEQRNRPERSFRDAAAKITEAWVNPKGGIDYRAVVFDPPTLEKLALMKKVGALDAMGTSVNYAGIATEVVHEGRTVDNIDSIDELNSLDFVTEPGAWGDIARMESLAAEVVAEPQKATKENTVDEATKKLIEGLQAQVETLTTTVQESRKEAQESEKNRRISETKATVVVALDKSGLPEICRSRILAHYDGQESAEGIEKVIEDEKTLVKTLTEGYVKKSENRAAPQRRTGVVVGLGNTGVGAKDGGVTEAEDEREPDADAFASSFESFMPGGKAGAKAFAEMMG
jgi:uncharacterized protein (DUF305 family)